jgi:transcription initiation factor TFIIB
MCIVTIEMIVRNESNKQVLVHEETTKFPKICTQNNGIHGPLITDSIRGEIFCGSCGLVLVDKVEDSGPEQYSFSLEQYNERSRTGIGSTLSIDDKGLSTVIGSQDKDAAGNSISSSMKYTFNRLRTWDSRSKTDSTERSLRSAFVILNTLKSKLDLSDTIVERAAYLYRKALTKKITQGRTIAGIIMASLYAACRETNAPRTLQDIANAGNITVKDLSRHYRVLFNTLELQLESYDSTDFVTRISSSVGLNEKTKRGALDILIKAKEKGITDGKNPISLAASALYISSVINEESVTQKKIADASGISSVTIRNVGKLIRKSLGMKNQ